MITVENGKELLKTLEDRKIVIYGAGYVAKRFYAALEKYNMEGKVKCFVTSKNSEENILGIASYTICQYMHEDEDIICIATHETLKEEIISLLTKCGIEEYVWIFPYIQELLYGNPLKKKQRIPIKNIIGNAADEYWMEIRYAAIECYFGRMKEGYDIYIKAMSSFINYDSAQKRLNKFIELIKNWEKNGYKFSDLVAVTEDYKIIDGAHRVTLACYTNLDMIIGDIYSPNDLHSDIHSKEARFTKGCFKNSGISVAEQLYLVELKKQIQTEYKVNI